MQQLLVESKGSAQALVVCYNSGNIVNAFDIVDSVS
jgi:hypothetical protein